MFVLEPKHTEDINTSLPWLTNYGVYLNEDETDHNETNNTFININSIYY